VELKLKTSDNVSSSNNNISEPLVLSKSRDETEAVTDNISASMLLKKAFMT